VFDAVDAEGAIHAVWLAMNSGGYWNEGRLGLFHEVSSWTPYSGT
jgi:hypothetical protein